MDTFENPTPAEPDANFLKAQVDSLRRMLSFSLVLFLLLCAAFNVFLLRQNKTLNEEAAQLNQQVPAMNATIVEFSKFIGSPPIQQMFTNLKAYSRTHPDITPILAKCGLSDAPSTSSTKGSPAPAPAKAPAAAPKK
jgi:hypothetical protein